MKAATTVFRMVRGPTDDAGGVAGSTSVSVPTPTRLPVSADGAGVGSAVGAGVWPGARLGAGVGFGVGLGVGPGRIGGGVDRMMSSWASAFAMSAACCAVSPMPVISTNVRGRRGPDADGPGEHGRVHGRRHQGGRGLDGRPERRHLRVGLGHLLGREDVVVVDPVGRERLPDQQPARRLVRRRREQADDQPDRGRADRAQREEPEPASREDQRGVEVHPVSVLPVSSGGVYKRAPSRQKTRPATAYRSMIRTGRTLDRVSASRSS